MPRLGVTPQTRGRRQKRDMRVEFGGADQLHPMDDQAPLDILAGRWIQELDANALRSGLQPQRRSVLLQIVPRFLAAASTPNFLVAVKNREFHGGIAEVASLYMNDNFVLSRSVDVGEHGVLRQAVVDCAGPVGHFQFPRVISRLGRRLHAIAPFLPVGGRRRLADDDRLLHDLLGQAPCTVPDAAAKA